MDQLKQKKLKNNIIKKVMTKKTKNYPFSLNKQKKKNSTLSVNLDKNK